MARTVVATGPDGGRWAIPYSPSHQRARTGLGNARGGDAARYVRAILATYADPDGTVRCTACRARCGIGRGTIVDGYALAAAEADRAIADLDGWTVEGGRTPYAPATVLPSCPLHNGDGNARRALDGPARDRLHLAALDALARHAHRLD